MSLGEKIQELRRKAAMSQDVLAEKLEVSRQAVSKWERDEAMPETDKIIRIAQLFGVSTDQLLLDEQPEPQPQPQYHAAPRQTQQAGQRVERFIRRHGYKGGYVLIGAGVFLCIIALLVMILLPNLGSGLFDAAKDPADSSNNGLYFEGDVDQEILDAIYDQAGSGYWGNGFFGGFEDEYNQSVSQMQNAWQSGVSVMAAMFGVPVLLFGGVLIAVGVYIVIKGKKLAENT